jgi:RHS repeat-associated protein
MAGSNVRTWNHLAIGIAVALTVVFAGMPSTPRAIGQESPPPEEPIEVPDLRSATSLTFLEPDGSYTARMYSGAINYQDATGSWLPIDNTLVPSSEPGYAFENAANSFKAFLPSDLGATPVKVATADHWVTFKLVGGTGTPYITEQTATTATYATALPGVSLSYETANETLKEGLVLQGPGSPAAFTFSGQSSPGLMARGIGTGVVYHDLLQEHEVGGGVEFYDFHDPNGVVFSIAPPFAVDAAGAVTGAEDISMTFNWDHSEFVLTVAVDPVWLADPSRQWPVTVDPTIGMNRNLDCHLASDTPASSQCGRSDLQAGYTGAHKRRILLSFDLSPLPPLPTVLKADLGLWVTAGSGSTPYRVHRVTKAWTNAATWNTTNGSTTWGTPGGDFSSTVSAERTVPAINEHRRWFPTGLVRDWVNGKHTNNGFLLKQATEATNNVVTFVSKENSGACPDPTNLATCKWPFLEVNYVRRLGELPSYRFWDFDLTDRMQARVNVATGNLVVRASDFAVPGTGLNLVVDRYYNGYEDRNVTKEDSGWRFTIPGNIRLTVFPSDGSVRYEGISGYKVPFIKKSDGSFESPPGIDAKLTLTGSNYALKFNKSEETYNFDSTGRWTSHVDRNNNTISFSYPSSTQIRITDTQNRITDVTTTAGGLITSIRDSGGRNYSYAYDAGHNLTTYTDPALGVTRFAYDSDKRLIQITTAGGSRTKFTYTASADKRVASVIQVLSGETGPTTTFAQDFPNSKTVVTDPRGKQTTYQWDKEARVTKVTDARGNIRSNTFNPNGNVLTATDAIQQGTLLSYNPQNDLTQVGIPTGATSGWTYANVAHPSSPSSSQDAQGNFLDYGYDGPGNLTSVTNRATGDRFSYSYNPNGTLGRITDAKLNVTNFFYDPAGNLTSIDYPGPLGTVSFAYTTTISRLSSMTDGKNQTSNYIYDALDRLTRITFQDGSQVNYFYDGNGNLTSRTDATGTTGFTYDPLNRMTRKDLPGGSFVTFGWDAAGNLLSLADSGGTVSYGYDNVNNVASLTEPGSHQTTFAYDANDNRISTVYPNGVKMGMARDNSGRVCKIASTRGTLPSPFTCASSAPSPLTSFSYTYAQGTTDRALRQTMTDHVTNDTTTYAYDTWNRLTTANRSATGAVDFQYAYDPVGNMTSKTISGTTTAMAYNAANELTSSGSTPFTYDGNGNLTGSPTTGLSFSYNAKNQTTSITPAGGSAIAFSYADATQRERTGKGSIAYVNHFLGIGNEQSGTQTNYRWSDFFTDSFALASQQVGSNRYYYLFDGLGSVVGVTDSSGNLVNTYAYEPYGKIRSSTGTLANPWRFAGAYFDTETSLYKMGARYYDANLARWTQPDPNRGSLSDPPSLNIYPYAANDPVNATDPEGDIVPWVAAVAFFTAATLVAPLIAGLAGSIKEKTGRSAAERRKGRALRERAAPYYDWSIQSKSGPHHWGRPDVRPPWIRR